MIRPCRDDERAAILNIVNAAAEAYRDVIPADRWHEPYMPAQELDAEMAAGVAFWGDERDGQLVGVMGIQPVRDVHLIRHAYVLPSQQGTGVGRALLEHLAARIGGPLLVGTWATATWAIRFYERNGFELVSPARKDELLRAYWDIPERQIETSVVLELRPPARPRAPRHGRPRAARPSRGSDPLRAPAPGRACDPRRTRRTR
ncbi:MAG: GNAT family N-acetyltransferase [Actinobacteria bacterium]|nr:MAG: GNAT family N-acetyltransferase [Actinomycetota bacterium]